MASARKSMMDQEMDPNKFDLRTHLFDNQGRLVKKNHYVLRVINGVSYYERPVNSGNLWFENNQPAGRLTKRDRPDKDFGPWSIDEAAPHKDFKPQLEGDEALQWALNSKEEQISALKKQLDDLRAKGPVQPTVTAAPLAETLAAPTEAPPTLPKKEHKR